MTQRTVSAGRVARTINSETGVGAPSRRGLRVGLLTLPFLAPLASTETVQPAPAAVQPLFSTIRCKTLNILITSCYPSL